MSGADLVHGGVLCLSAMMIVLTALTMFRNKVSGATRVASIISMIVPVTMLVWPDWPFGAGYEWLWFVDIGGIFATITATLGERHSWRAHKLTVIFAVANVMLPIIYFVGGILYIARDLGATL